MFPILKPNCTTAIYDDRNKKWTQTKQKIFCEYEYEVWVGRANKTASPPWLIRFKAQYNTEVGVARSGRRWWFDSMATWQPSMPMPDSSTYNVIHFNHPEHFRVVGLSSLQWSQHPSNGASFFCAQRFSAELEISYSPILFSSWQIYDETFILCTFRRPLANGEILASIWRASK